MLQDNNSDSSGESPAPIDLSSSRDDTDGLRSHEEISGHRFLFVSDTHDGLDGINGVARTIACMRLILERWGNQVEILQTKKAGSIPLPFHPEVRLSVRMPGTIQRLLQELKPTRIHIFTEGPLGFQFRLTCKRLGYKFTTSYHTQWVDFLKDNHPVISSLLPDGGWPMLRWFHGSSETVMTRTETIREELLEKGFSNVELWPGGVDPDLFFPRPSEPKPWNTLTDTGGKQVHISDQEKVLLYVGRVSKEKNLDDLLGREISGTRVVVAGGGAYLETLVNKYPQAVFLGMLPPEKLPPLYAAADLFVHPGKHETFCLGVAEALMCDTKVAAYANKGLLNVVDDPRLGVLHENDLGKAIERALALDTPAGFCAQYAKERYSTEVVTRKFFTNSTPSGFEK